MGLLEDYDYMAPNSFSISVLEDSSKTDAMVERIMDKISGLLSLLPSIIRDRVAAAIEKVLRLQISLGTAAVRRLLDLIGDHFGETVKTIIDMVKACLDDFERAEPASKNTFEYIDIGDLSKTDAMIDKIMEKLRGDLALLPSILQSLVGHAIEQVLRLQISIGTTASKKLLDLIGDHFGQMATKIVNIAKNLLDEFEYIEPISSVTYGDGSKQDAIIETIMDRLETPLSLLPKSIQRLVAQSIEKVLRLRIHIGTSAVKKLLDLIGHRFGETVGGIVDMAKALLDDFDYDYGIDASTEFAVKEIIDIMDLRFLVLSSDFKETISLKEDEDKH